MPVNTSSMEGNRQFNALLQSRLDEIRTQRLYRELREIESAQGRLIQYEGRQWLNFSSNDYLGLANHPHLIEAAQAVSRRYGVGSGASRLICGSLKPHRELEEALAAFKGVEAAITFSSGYATAIGAICSLIGAGDVVILDKLVHACIVDAARQCGAKMRVFRHNDLENLESILKWSRKRADEKQGQILIITESIFSMDGDTAPLGELVALKEKYGAFLMVDEAHATGLFGTRGSGLCEQNGVTGHVEIQMGTLSKAIGSSGGFIMWFGNFDSVFDQPCPQLYLFHCSGIACCCGC